MAEVLRALSDHPDDVENAWQVVRNAEAALGLSDPSTRDRIGGLMTDLVDLHASRLVVDDETPVGLLLVCPVPGRTVFLEVHACVSQPEPLFEVLVREGVRAAQFYATRESQQGASGATASDDGRPDPNHWQVGAAPDATDKVYRRVLAAEGFRLGLQFWRMRLSLDAPPWELIDPPPPLGVVRTTARSDSDLRRVHEVFTEAFRDHTSSVAVPFDQWWRQLSQRPGFDADGVWLAWQGGIPIGMCIVDDSRADVGDGFLRNVGVLRHARGRGVGRWLVACAAWAAVQRGRRGLALTVDSGSTTGAPQLYKSMGFQVRQTTEDWRRLLA